MLINIRQFFNPFISALTLSYWFIDISHMQSDFGSNLKLEIWEITKGGLSSSTMSNPKQFPFKETSSPIASEPT